MVSNGDIGRIHKKPFLVSNLLSSTIYLLTKESQISSFALLGVCFISTCFRLYIRIRVQKQFSIDDGFLLLSFVFLVAGLTLLCTFMDKMYLMEALLFGGPEALANLPSDWMEQAFDYQRKILGALLCTWLVIVCVKMSFLFFFKKLTERVRGMRIFWWVAFVYNVLACGYGVSVYVATCPEFGNIKACKLRLRNLKIIGVVLIKR